MESFASGDYLPTLQDLDGAGQTGDLSYEALHLPALHAPPDTPDLSEIKPKGKKRKSDAGAGNDAKVKKTRQSQSCDACRARKVRCDRPPPGSTAAIDPSLPTKDVCTHCAHLGLECRFEYKPKKRGPPNQYLRKLNESGTPDIGDTPDHGAALLRESSPFAGLAYSAISTSEVNPGSNTNAARQDTLEPFTAASGWYRSDPPIEQGGPGPGTLAEQRSAHATALQTPGSGTHHDYRTEAEHHWEPSLMAVLRASAGNNNHSETRTLAHHDEARTMFTPLAPFSYDPSPRLDVSPQTHVTASPSVTTPFANYPHNPNNPFDVVLPRGLLYLVVDLYFDYLYGLTPYIHRPTFMRDLHENREEKPDAEEWITLVMGLVCSTLVQIPRAFVPLPRAEVKALVDKTYGMVAVFLSKPFRQSTTTRHVLLYMAGLTCTLLGLRPLWAEYFGRSWAMTCQERSNEESTYAALSPVEREIRRRVFWLGMGGDKSAAVLEGISPIASESSTATVKLPSLTEDEYISDIGESPMPEGHTSILTGFYYISKLFRLTGQVLEKRLHDRLSPPTGILLQMRVNEINGLYDEVMSLMDDCPPELRLDTESDAPSVGNLSEDWDWKASREVRSLLLDPKASRTVAKDAFLVQQANIYVTQQMTRYIILQYRDDLLTLQQDELSTQARSGAAIGRFSAGQRRLETTRALFSDEEKEQVCGDLLAILQKIPIQVIAVNSVALVAKVRFVASTLLDALNVNVEGGSSGSGGASGVGRSSTRVQRAQTYLWDFLRILTEIEALYSMEDEEPAT